MSKLNEYRLSRIETNEFLLEHLFDTAISLRDMTIFVQALSYSEGLVDAYDAMLMTKESNSISLIVKKKTSVFNEEMKTDE